MPSEMQRLLELEDESSRLKKMVAERVDEMQLDWGRVDPGEHLVLPEAAPKMTVQDLTLM